jgi:hypothetical protein
VSRIFAQIRRLIRPPRVVSLTRRPAGWFAVGRRRLHDVVAWAQLEDGQVVGLVADRRGLRPATGRRFHGYLAASPHSGRDIQLAPPAVSVPVVDLDEAIGSGDVWTSDAQAAIYDRLRLAADSEWAWRAFSAFVADPERFLRRHFALITEHGRAAELDADWRAGLESITEPPARAGIQEENHHDSDSRGR